MDKEYWIGRKRAAMAMARAATDSEARLIHYDLAGRYSVRAAHGVPFMLPRQGPVTEGEGAALRLHASPPPATPEPGERSRSRPGKKPGGPSVRGH